MTDRSGQRANLDSISDTPAELRRQKARSDSATSAGASNASRTDGNDAPAMNREQALKKELEGLRSINEVVEGVLASLDKAKGNMDTVSKTVSSASTLLNTWARILSQTEHNQRLILNPNWQGATQDMQDLENDALLKQQAAERRELEEQQRKEAAALAAKRDAEQRQREVEVISRRGVGRTRGRGIGRGSYGSATDRTAVPKPPLGGSSSASRGSRGARGSIGTDRGTSRGKARGIK